MQNTEEIKEYNPEIDNEEGYDRFFGPKYYLECKSARCSRAGAWTPDPKVLTRKEVLALERRLQKQEVLQKQFSQQQLPQQSNQYNLLRFKDVE